MPRLAGRFVGYDSRMAQEHEPEVTDELEEENGEVFPDREAMSTLSLPGKEFPTGPDELPPHKPA